MGRWSTLDRSRAPGCAAQTESTCGAVFPPALTRGWNPWRVCFALVRNQSTTSPAPREYSVSQSPSSVARSLGQWRDWPGAWRDAPSLLSMLFALLLDSAFCFPFSLFRFFLHDAGLRLSRLGETCDHYPRVPLASACRTAASALLRSVLPFGWNARRLQAHQRTNFTATDPSYYTRKCSNTPLPSPVHFCINPLW